MTISEFNAWLDGFEEGFGGSPTKAQWVKIRAKFGEVVRDERWPLYTVQPQPLMPTLPSRYWHQTTSGAAFSDRSTVNLAN